MKQAYTNTIRGGGRTPLTIATGKKGGRGGGPGKKSSRKQELPKCAYGSSCTRRGCAFRHPPRGSESTPVYESYHDDPRSKICKPFLSGLCTFGAKCMNRHPGTEEADAVRATYKQKSCSYGDDCQTEGCLYFHPWEALESAVETDDSQYLDQDSSHHYYGGDINAGMEGLHINGSTATQSPTYEQWLESGCLPPPNVNSIQLFNMWHYPGSGMQRGPWDVYNLMYPQSASAGLSAISKTWEPSTGLVAAAEVAGQGVEPKSFQEWKKKGCPYPKWFYDAGYADDPWYDEEGVRRSLEEVYDVLYGKDAQSIYQENHVAPINTDPTPAELAEMIQTKDPSLTESKINESSTLAKGGWASIAAKRPEPDLPQSVINQASNSSAVNSGTIKKAKTVVIPKEVWLPDTANSDYFHLYPNPIDRFVAVNEHHKSYLSSVTIPKSFENSMAKNGNVSLLDVHFQSAKTVPSVLDYFLTPALNKNDEVWVVTGSGHHVAVGHQRRESGGVLFNAVKRYLEEHEDDLNLEFRVGKDTSGGKNSSGGAFLVRKIS